MMAAPFLISSLVRKGEEYQCKGMKFDKTCIACPQQRAVTAQERDNPARASFIAFKKQNYSDENICRICASAVSLPH